MLRAARFALLALTAFLTIGPRRRPRSRGCRSGSSTTRPSAGRRPRSTIFSARPQTARRSSTRLRLGPRLRRRGLPSLERRRPRVQARRPRRARLPALEPLGMRVMINITGTPKWANGNKKPNVMPKKLADLTTFARMLATRYNGLHGQGLRRTLVGLERAEPAAVPDAAVRRQEDRQRRELREALQGRVRRHQGRQPAAKVAIGETSAQGRDKPLRREQPTDRPGDVREAALAAEGAQVRRVGASSVSDVADRQPIAEGALPERDALDDAEVREGPAQVVPPHGADLDHRVRPRDEAGRAARRVDGDAGGVREAGARDREARTRTCRCSSGSLPRQRRQPVAERPAPPVGRPKPAYSAFGAVARLTDGLQAKSAPAVRRRVTMYLPYLAYYNERRGRRSG